MVAAPKPPAKPFKTIGTRPVRHDGVDKVTGRAVYGADVRPSGVLYGRVKRSPHAHAIVKRIDVSKALALPGVRAVITHADLPDPGDLVVYQYPAGPTPMWRIHAHHLADKKVLFPGHAIAAVCATDLHIAEDALELIEVEYELLPAVVNVRDAMLDSAPILHDDLRTEEVLAAPQPSAAAA
ncbi:MAG: hypothetical protein EXR63_00890 [Dehalococcoidia bacterium]|nr:hypothetical protein [Dehalococcoidia bacterium]